MTFTMLGDECVLYCRLVFGRTGTERRQFRSLLSRGFSLTHLRSVILVANAGYGRWNCYGYILPPANDPILAR